MKNRSEIIGNAVMCRASSLVFIRDKVAQTRRIYDWLFAHHWGDPMYLECNRVIAEIQDQIETIYTTNEEGNFYVI